MSLMSTNTRHLNDVAYVYQYIQLVVGEESKSGCPTCKGEKVVQQKKVLEVHIEKGMRNGQKITFSGEADEALDILLLEI
ncbi:hypothetical protein QQ045_001018 [Rhodiola kirilowii]